MACPGRVDWNRDPGPLPSANPTAHPSWGRFNHGARRPSDAAQGSLDADPLPGRVSRAPRSLPAAGGLAAPPQGGSPVGPQRWVIWNRPPQGFPCVMSREGA